MTIVSISRDKICEAIAKEPATRLQAGSWIHFSTRYDRGPAKVKSKNCSVCAVGAVMRNALLNRDQDAYAVTSASLAAVKGAPCDGDTSPVQLAKRGRYMNALSVFFEREWENRIEFSGISDRAHNKIVSEIKADCIDFVKKYFPKTVKIDIDGALPAADVKVVRG